MNMRRALIIIAAVIVLIGIGVGIYFLLFRGNAHLTVGGGEFPSADSNALPNEGTSDSIQELGTPLPGAGTELAPRLVRISDRPVALGVAAVYVPGTPPVATTSASSTVARDPDVRVEYVERESGNIYGYQVHGRTLTRLSNRTLPGIQEASWLADGSLAFVRFLEKNGADEHIDTYALPADGSTGYFLEQDLDQVLVKGTSTLVTLLSTTDGSSASISTPSGAGLKSLFTTPLSSLRTAFSGKSYTATTKASSVRDGYAFIVDGGVLTRALGPLSGLVTLPSPNGKYILYSYQDRGKTALAVLDLATHIATRLPLSTIADKCVWTTDDASLYCGIPTSLQGNLPDDWYQGAVHFTDRLWKIDMNNRVATLLIDPSVAGNVDIDAVALTLDRTNDALIFTNKRDHLLYAYDL